MKRLIITLALCLCAGITFGQSYSELLYKDWASLRAYAQVNKTLGIVRPEVVFMGNSITEGWFNQHPEFFRRNNFVGRGIGGQTSSEMLVRFRQDVLNLHPQCVAILAGTNDIAMNNGFIALENTFQNIVSMCELARFNGVRVLLCSVTPCARFPWREQVDASRLIPALNILLQEYADKTEGVEFVDYFSAMADAHNAMLPALSPEGCHPNGEGYKVMERVLVEALQKATGVKKEYFVY